MKFMKVERQTTCPECRLGTLEWQNVFFFMLQDGQPICVPNFPAWVCTFCSRREYDSTAMVKLHAMLETDRKTRRKYIQPRSFVGEEHPSKIQDPQSRVRRQPD
jgi:YgiT-type zinc finger domain-containing protein